MERVQKAGSTLTKRSERLRGSLWNEKLQEAGYTIGLTLVLIGLLCVPVMLQVQPNDRPNSPTPKPPTKVAPRTNKRTTPKTERSNTRKPDHKKETEPESTAGGAPARIPANNTLSVPPSGTPKVEAKRNPLPLMPFVFDVVTVNARENMPAWRKGQAQYFSENIGGVILEMVEIPAGTFWMGSTEAEADQVRREGELTGKVPAAAATLTQVESPRHQVKVPLFYIGKFEVTQAQWRAVASLPRISRDLNPAPSHFKGDDLPVENITWDEAMEFCLRLSALTGKKYRLPSEAEWEYACRAGTVTPFHFGEITASWLLNYCGTYPFGSVAKGVCRGQTTPGGYLEIANAFGLYDMHGNVWEWCADPWHDNYINAPSNGSVWERGGATGYQVMRGGSWMTFGYRARSATRASAAPNSKASDHGFRVAAEAAHS